MTDADIIDFVPLGWQRIMADMMAELRAQPRGDEIAVLHVDRQANAELFVILDTPDAVTREAAEAIVDRARVASRDTCQRCGDPSAEIMSTTKGPVRKCRDCGTRDDTEISFEEAARILGTHKHALIRRMESGEISGRRWPHGFYTMSILDLRELQRKAAPAGQQNAVPSERPPTST